MEETLPAFGASFAKLFLLNVIFQTFQNCGILDLAHVCICQYYRYGSEKLYSSEHVHGSSNWSM